MNSLQLENLFYRKRNFIFAYIRHRFLVMCKQSLIRVQSAEGMKRIEISPDANLKQLFDSIQKTLKVDGFGIFKERNFTKEIYSNTSANVGSCLRHGDIIFLKQLAGTSLRRTSTTAIDAFETAASSVEPIVHNNRQSTIIEEDEIDKTLSKMDGLIKRPRDSKLCRHAANGCCLHCSPLEPYDESYLKEQKIKHLSFHAYIRKQTFGIDRGKYVVFEDINCRIKPGCSSHPAWPKGICSKCQPSAITLNHQTYRHVDNVMFENTTIVERFLNYWRATGHQRMGFLYGTYEVHADVPLGIRAKVAAIYEPPQESTKDSIKLLDDENAADVDNVANALGLRMVGWIFTDLITDDQTKGTVKQLRGIETHFLTAHECIMAGHLQNRHRNPCKYASNGYFGSKFVTVCVTGDKAKQVHMEGYAVSAQCMALVRDDCLVPTKDAPELAYVRESTDKQYVPDVFYKEKDQYGNEVQRLARPLPIEYLIVDVPASTPLQQQYTFTQYDKRQPFPVENRYLEGHLQDFNALSAYLANWTDEEFLEAVSDFHLLIYLHKMDVLPFRQHMGPLLEAIRSKNLNLAQEFKRSEVWKLLESLIHASSSGSGGTSTYPTSAAAGAASSSSASGGRGGRDNATGTAASDTTGKADGSNWTCLHCTFINRSDMNSCEICSLPRN